MGIKLMCDAQDCHKAAAALNDVYLIISCIGKLGSRQPDCFAPNLRVGVS